MKLWDCNSKLNSGSTTSFIWVAYKQCKFIIKIKTVNRIESHFVNVSCLSRVCLQIHCVYCVNTIVAFAKRNSAAQINVRFHNPILQLREDSRITKRRDYSIHTSMDSILAQKCGWFRIGTDHDASRSVLEPQPDNFPK